MKWVRYKLDFQSKVAPSNAGAFCEEIRILKASCVRKKGGRFKFGCIITKLRQSDADGFAGIH